MTHQQQMRLGGLSAIVGGVLWVASIAWYAQQPIGEDDLKEGWEMFNRLVTLIPVLFAAPLFSMQRASSADHDGRIPRALLAVLVSIAALAVFRLLVDLGILPSPFAFLAIMFFAATFLWYLIATLRAGAFSRVTTGALLVATLVMLAFIGTESNLIWFAAPLGIAWIGVGAVLLMSQSASMSIDSS